MRNKLLRDLMNSWKTFSASCWLWKRSPCKKLSRCLKKWWLARGQVNMVNEAKLHRLVCSAFEVLLVQWLGVAVEKNWALSVDLCWLQALQLSVHLIDSLSTPLKCNGFTTIQKAIVHQISSRSPNSDHDHFLVQVWLWSFFSVQPLSWSSPVAV